jgi:hypothetical protein
VARKRSGSLRTGDGEECVGETGAPDFQCVQLRIGGEQLRHHRLGRFGDDLQHAVAAIRAWQVVDQTIPVPYSLTDADWSATDWSALKDICANELANVRRHPAIRAQVGQSFNESGIVYNARLIGRSVWNDQWYIFIPAATINANNARARAAFLDSVRDIHLNLKTYSFSGN